MVVPLGVVLFVVGLIVSLISYLWATHAKRIDKLERTISAVDMEKCHSCEPVTVAQITTLFDARFNEFRIELYQSGVLKPHTPRARKVPSASGQ